MSYRYSPSTGGFYHDDQTAPSDAVEITDSEYDALFAAQASGQEIQAGTNGQPQAVTPSTTPVPQTVFPFRQFIGLFTQDEQVALFKARTDQSNPTLAVQVDMFITLASAGPVDLTNADVVADVNACVTAGLLTQARAQAILAGQTPPAPTTGN